ncbi:MAG TPA: hypothetical protein DDZ80_22495 [Cyanobacteria bacterium UBA8803]|nr:hypothetical protein [Cyanobacteria bacterium UBA9273]HBL61097.1 hypothetical protein [Cyanobacteria bacterium UBA8803]
MTCLSINWVINGYYLGRVIPDVDKYLLPIVVGIIIISILPSLIHLIKENRSNQQFTAQDGDYSRDISQGQKSPQSKP